jgi:hypothetical protein
MAGWKHKGPGDHFYEFGLDYHDITNEVTYASDLKHKMKVKTISLPDLKKLPLSKRKMN